MHCRLVEIRNDCKRLKQSLSVCYAGFIISEANRLNGVWLLARCADLKQLNYSVADFHLCLGMLVVIGLIFRALALLGIYTLNRSKHT